MLKSADSSNSIVCWNDTTTTDWLVKWFCNTCTNLSVMKNECILLRYQHMVLECREHVAITRLYLLYMT